MSKDKKEEILIIKTGYSEVLDYNLDSRVTSLGDILRTTPLLHLYKDANVTWVTDNKAFPLLNNNPYILRLLPFDWITAQHLVQERFDTLINLEKAPGICALSDNIYATKRYGFRYDPEHRTAEAYDEAVEVLTVGSDINIKRKNKKTVQQLLFEMVGKKWNNEEYVLGYKPKTKEVFDIGFNSYVGDKWPVKGWPKEYWSELQKKCDKDFSLTLQEEQGPKVLKDLNGYMDWINSSKLIVTSDSLGMHLAIVLKKKVISLFGPTPHEETHFYGRGKAILPKPMRDCIPCFESSCKKNKNCMYDISVDTVYKEIFNSMKNEK